ncbi:hypothetical protein KHQ81_13140 [Mycoplasmatota bacterium]|nr:hypothetical protein KHQ81_13140 [Mycoplasmatota bacterium]
MELKEFFLDEDIKKQLGYIIRETRKMNFNECKNTTLIEHNPYTKENFCENNCICHYHTLTKLENDVIKEDAIYHTLLKKLDIYYQVNQKEHEAHMKFIDEIIEKVLHASEYIDDDLILNIKKEIMHVYFHNDIIAEMYIFLIKLIIKLHLIENVDFESIMKLEKFIDFYNGVTKGLVNQCLGIYYLNKLETEKAKKYFIDAKEIYQEFNVDKGLISPYLIAVYVHTNDYYHSVPLCTEMEVYYKNTNNYKRLMHVYNYLSEYYFLINAHTVAKDYFDKAIKIIDNDETLERFKYPLFYNWAFRCFKDNLYIEALEDFITAYHHCKINSNKLQTINMILIIMTKLKYNSDQIEEFYNEGKKYIEYSNEANKNIFKYFRFKIEKNRYYRKFAYEKIIPKLTDDRSKNEILLFFYEDLYK